MADKMSSSRSPEEPQQGVDDAGQQYNSSHTPSFTSTLNPNGHQELRFPFTTAGSRALDVVYVIFAILAKYMITPLPSPIEETSADSPSKLVVSSPSPRLLQDGDIEQQESNPCLNINGLLYFTSESARKARPGRCLKLHSKVFASTCGKFVLKKHILDFIQLQRWKDITSDFIMRLQGIVYDEKSSAVYEVTDKMTGDLGTMRKTYLIKIAESCNPALLKSALSQVKKISISILTGITDLNKCGFQHYDITEKNILVKKPLGCSCSCILNCDHTWEVKVSKLTTLDKLQQSFNSASGCKCNSPPEIFEMDDHTFPEPKFDIYSFGVLLLNFCISGEDFVRKKMTTSYSWTAQSLQFTYAKDMLQDLDKCCMSHEELVPWCEIIKLCINEDYLERPTADEVLIKINDLK